MLGPAQPGCQEEGAYRFLDTVHRLGCELLYKLAGEKLGELANRFVDQFRLSMKIDPPGNLAPIVEVDTPGLFFPLETLPLLGLKWPPADTLTKAELFSRARAFVGMSAVVRRIPRVKEGLDQDPVLTSVPLLPVKLFYHADLAGASEEARFFQRLRDKIALDGPWPLDQPKRSLAERATRTWRVIKQGIGVTTDGPECAAGIEAELRQKKFADEITRYLINPDISFAGNERRPPDQIHHFSCHCRKAEAGDYALALKGDNGFENEIRIGDIQTSLVRLLDPLSAGIPCARPLVFLNACASGITEANDFASFEGLFATTKHRGLIATQTAVPDRFASRFAELFYNALLDRKTVGQALHIARWDMFHLYLNPLGLLYNVYGNSEMKISDPDGGVPRAAQA
jgi:hypothetical protein